MQPAIFASPYRAGSPISIQAPAVGYDRGPIPHIDENYVAFSRQPATTQALKIVNFKNKGTRPIDLDSVSGNTEIGVSVTIGVTVLPGGELPVTLTWTPASAGLFVDESIVFNCTEGATPYNYTMKVTAASVDVGGLSLVNHGAGGTLTVSADDTKYTLTADCNYIVVNAGVTNWEVDIAGFDVIYADGLAQHGVSLIANGIQHGLINDSVGTGEIVQFDDTQDEIDSIHIDGGTIKAIDIVASTRPKGRTCGSVRCVDNGGPQGIIIRDGSDNSECPAIGPENYVHPDSPNRGGLWYILKIGRSGLGADTWLQVRNRNVSQGAQGGISFEWLANYAQITGSSINHTETTENGAGISGGHYLEMWGNNIGGGTCYGDGARMEGSHCRVWDNTISVRRNPGHVGYWATDHTGPAPPLNGGQEVYGIQVDPDDNAQTDTIIWGNDVTVTAYDGAGGDAPNSWGGYPLRLTAIPELADVTIVDNIFRIVREVGSTVENIYVAALSFSSAGGFIVSHNTIITDGDFIYCDFDGTRGNSIVANNTVIDGSNLITNPEFLRMGYGTGWEAHLDIFDTDLSASSLTSDDVNIATGIGGGVIDIKVGYTQTMSTAVPGALVSIDDAQLNTVDSGAANGSGDFESLLYYRTYAGATAATMVTTNTTPHLVDVTAAGYNDNLDNAVTADAEKTTTITMVPV